MLDLVYEYFFTLNWTAVAKIIMIDILLGGDNAVIIALACRDLPATMRKQGIIWGTAGAIILRVLLIAFAMKLLEIPFLKLTGGILLLWIGIKLMIQQDGHGEVASSDRLWSAIKTIIIADFVMSFDNVIAIAGAAQLADPEHQMGLVIFGLVLSVPIIVWGSQFVIKLLDKYPVVITLGAALLGWIAGSLILNDIATLKYLGINGKDVLYQVTQEHAIHYYHVAELVGALFVVGMGKFLLKKQLAKNDSNLSTASKGHV